MAVEGAWARMNTHDSVFVTVELLGHTLRLSQDPSSEHLGTTVWDASICLAKMLEKGQRKGEFSRSKLAGWRVLELGAGMGLGGIAAAMLGADVTITDTADVLPLLKRNVEINLGPGTGVGYSKARVCELDWMQPHQLDMLHPPFDLVIAADCIYAEHIVPHFHAICMAATTPKSTLLVVNELRSHSVHRAFMEAFTATHTVKQMPSSKLDAVYQHELIHVYVCKMKRKGAAGSGASEGRVEPALANNEMLERAQPGAEAATEAGQEAVQGGVTNECQRENYKSGEDGSTGTIAASLTEGVDASTMAAAAEGLKGLGLGQG